VAERRVHTASFVVGLLSLVFAGLYLVDSAGAASVDEYVVAASTLVALGVAGVAASVRRLLRSLADRPG
jgi:hypothetical protein